MLKIKCNNCQHETLFVYYLNVSGNSSTKASEMIKEAEDKYSQYTDCTVWVVPLYNSGAESYIEKLM